MRRLTLPVLLLATATGCSSGVITYRNVDSPAGTMQQYGAPKNLRFEVAADVSNDLLKLTIFQHSECDVIKIDLTSRVRETLKDDAVVHRDAPTRIQKARPLTGTVIPCERTYARDVAVSLAWGDSTYPLGSTSAFGQLEVSLSKELRQYLYSDDAQPSKDASVVIDWQDRGRIGRSTAGTISGDKLTQTERRINALLEELNQLLVNTDLSEPKDILRSYQIYAELRQLDSAGDPRIAAAITRFLELFFERKRLEERVERKLDAMDELEMAALYKAKSLLQSGLVVVPGFVAAAVNDGALTEPALNWLLGQTITLARSVPGLCQSQFSWQSFEKMSWDSLTEFTFSYNRYAYGESFAAQMPRLCQRARGW